MKLPRILILGGEGMLGSKLANVCEAHSIPYATTSRRGILITNKEWHTSDFVFDAVRGEIDLVLNSIPSISVVINCIGIVKQSPTASDKFQMFKVNAEFPRALMLAADKRNVRVIQISTDCVFSGKKGNYRESDVADPVDDYGGSKLLGEEIANQGAMVLRTSIIGPESGQVKKGLLEWFLDYENLYVPGFTNVYFSGLTTMSLSEIILSIIESDLVQGGLWNIAGEKISKFELLNKLNQNLKLGKEIMPTESVPLDRSLDAGKMTRLLSINPPTWDTMLSLQDWSSRN